MDIQQYLTLAPRTKSPQWHSDQPPDVVHAILGLGTEVGEFIEALHLAGVIDRVNQNEEIGDMMWYLALYHDHRKDALAFLDKNLFGGLRDGENNPTSVNFVDLGMVMTVKAGQLLDHVKRALFYGKPLDLVAIDKLVGDFILLIGNYCWLAFVDIEKICAANIAKLQARFPAKFTDYEALNRDLGAERVALEENL